MRSKVPTVLELVILGVFHKKTSSTAYAVAKEFTTSPSSHWSGSAGAIYPIVERLSERGYLARRADRMTSIARPTPSRARGRTHSGAGWLLNFRSPMPR